jgi:phytoene desaturase
MARKVIVIGAGFSGLSTAAYLARQGFKVEIIEKNSIPGGRARKLEADGFTFDMGPSWYWMPEVFERFFAHFDTHPLNHYELVKLNPGFRVFCEDKEHIDVPAGHDELIDLFEKIEPGSGKKLNSYLNTAHKHYRLVMNKLIYKSGNHIFEYLNPKLLSNLLFSSSLQSFSGNTRRLFKDKRLRRIMDFPMLFLGSIPSKTPALFSMINYVNFESGIWYPKGGMYKVVEAMEKVCHDFGVDISYNINVDQIDVLKGRVSSAHIGHRNFYGEYFVSSADYPHTDSHLLSTSYSNYTNKYWEKKVIGPSALIYYLGINKKIPNLLHHNLFVDVDFDKQINVAVKNPKWPENPAFFVTAASKTDESVALEGCENLVVLIPVASGLVDSGKIREHYFDMIINRLENFTGTSIREHIVYHKSYAQTDFSNDYNAYKGNAFGLANLFNQMGPFRPKISNRKLPNLFYTGHFTVPGSGVPTAIISGEIAAREIYRASGSRKS